MIELFLLCYYTMLFLVVYIIIIYIVYNVRGSLIVILSLISQCQHYVKVIVKAMTMQYFYVIHTTYNIW